MVSQRGHWAFICLVTETLQVQATKLASFFPLSKWPPAILVHLKQETGPLAVACSGGADSVCLLFLLFAHFPQKIVVLHYNHNLRGDESDQDVIFVKNLAEELGCPSQIGKRCPSKKRPNETELRESRMAFFRESLQTIGSHLLFQGHQKEDVAETLLLRLMRGSGVSGLCVPRPCSVFSDGTVFLRPLLNERKSAIVKALQTVGISWREDASNEELYYLRNRIRKQVLPVWQKVGETDIYEALARTRSQLEEEEQALEWVLAQVGLSFSGTCLSTKVLQGFPKAFWRRALSRWLQNNQLLSGLNARAFEQLLESIFARRSFRMSVGPRQFLTATSHAVSLAPEKVVVGWHSSFIVGFPLFFPSGYVLRSKWVSLDKKYRQTIVQGGYDNRQCVFLSLQKQSSLTVRTWQPGDRYCPLGMVGSKKIQDIFTDRKVAPWLRFHLPIVVDSEGGILWCPGLPPAEKNKITERTQLALRLTYQKVE